jgi:hypothetical protein
VSLPKTTTQFDDDEFDFPDIPTSGDNVATNQVSVSAFDDEFANFDDDFDNPSSQVQSNSDKSYEVVSVPQSSSGQDEWGLPKLPTTTASNTLSFDDAFGGDFSP